MRAVKIVFFGQCFNSRSREGATQSIEIRYASTRVSIHAPVRERRSRRAKAVPMSVRFNSRSREGATETAFCQAYGRRFNSRSREGATS